MGLLRILWHRPASILRSHSQKDIFKAIIAVLCVWLIGCIYFFASYQASKDIEATRENLSVDEQPNISSNQVSFMDGSIFYQKVAPVKDDHDFALIWLHGAAFTSQTWIDLEILQNIEMRDGYTSYAIDVPRYGKSTAPKLPYNNVNNNWLIAMIDNILKSEKQQRTKFVLVTPSMSGKYAIPLLMEEKLQAQLDERDLKMIGLIAVAPVGTQKYDEKEYQAIEMPISIIYGERDTKAVKVSVKNLKQTKHNTVNMIPNGIHSCYQTDVVFFTDFVLGYLKQF